MYKCIHIYICIFVWYIYIYICSHVTLIHESCHAHLQKIQFCHANVQTTSHIWMSLARTHAQTCTRKPTHTHTHTLACAHKHLNALAEHLPQSIRIAPKNTARIHMCENGAGMCMCGFLPRGGGLGSRPKKMYGETLGDGVEYHSMKPTPRR